MATRMTPLRPGTLIRKSMEWRQVMYMGEYLTVDTGIVCWFVDDEVNYTFRNIGLLSQYTRSPREDSRLSMYLHYLAHLHGLGLWPRTAVCP